MQPHIHTSTAPTQPQAPTQASALKVKTRVKAGGVIINQHCVVKTHIKAGGIIVDP